MSDTTVKRFDDLVDSFEDGCKSGVIPDVVAYLENAEPAARPALLSELVRLELEYKLRAGQAVCVEDCLTRYPGVASSRKDVLDLIVLEARVRLACAQPVRIAEYLQRFPDYGNELAAGLSTLAGTTVKVPGYEVLEELGRGGMGVVYRARDVRLNRPVALKMILAGVHAEEEDRSRFRREAEAIARLQHPGVVQIHEVGEHDGHPFFALEYCSGGGLDRKLVAGPMQPPEAAALVEKIAHAVQAAHDAQVIHRDLKPANVLLTADGVPKVTDFGLAKRLDDAGNTQSGAILGTPSYMAPEQASGRTKEIGPLSDVYSLGAILYECLTGRPPFRAATALDTVMQVVSADPVAPTLLNAKVPIDLETICLKCLHKEPAKRYASAAELADDLRRFSRGEIVKARPTGRTEKVWRWCKRNPLATGLATAVSMALISVAVTVSVSAVNILDARERADEKAAEATKAQGEAEKALSQVKMEFARAEENAKKTRLEQARQFVGQGLRIQSDDPLGALLWFTKALEKNPEDSLNRRRVATMISQYPLEQMWMRVHQAQFSGDGKRLVTSCSQATVMQDHRQTIIRPSSAEVAMVHDVATGDPIARFQGNGTFVVSAINREGTKVATSTGAETTVWEVATEKPVFPALEHQGHVAQVSFSPNGKFFGVLGSGNQGNFIQAWDLETGKPLYTPINIGTRAMIGFNGGGIASAQIDPTSSAWRIVCQRNNAEIEVWDMATGLRVWQIDTRDNHDRATTIANLWAAGAQLNETTPWLFSQHLSQMNRMFEEIPSHRTVISRDGNFAATVHASAPGMPPRGKVRIWNTRTGQPVGAAIKRDSRLYCAEFDYKGTRLITGWEDGIVQMYDGSNLNPVGPSLKHDGPLLHLAFSPDGRLAATVSRLKTDPPKVGIHGKSKGEVRLWDIASGSMLASPWPQMGTDPGGPISFSPDGSRLLAITSNWVGESAQLWNVKSLFAKSRALPNSGGIRGAQFSADGRRIYSFTLDRDWHGESGEPITPEARKVEVGKEIIFVPVDEKRMYSERFLSGDIPKPMERRTTRFDIATREVERRIPASEKGNFAPQSAPSLIGSQHILSYSNDHRFFVSNNNALKKGERGEARVWDATGKPITPPLPHKGHITHASFSGDANFLVTVCEFEQVQVWDVKSGEPVTPPLRNGGPVLQATLCPKGRRLIIVNGVEGFRFNAGNEVIWLRDLVPLEERSPESLRLFIQSLASQHIDDTGDLEFVDAARRQVFWETYQTPLRFASGFADAKSRRAWLKGRALQAIDNEQWSLSLLHLNRLISEPNVEASDYGKRGKVHAELGDWKAALSDYESALKLDSGEFWIQSEAAKVRLHHGDLAGYRTLIRRLLERFEDGKDPDQIWSLLFASVLVPDEGVDPERVVRLARRFQENFPNSDFQDVLAPALFRAGKHSEALKIFENAPKLPNDEFGNKSMRNLFQGLILHHLGKKKEAREMLRQVYLPDRRDSDRFSRGAIDFLRWQDLLELQILHREASTLINPDAKSAN